MPRYRCYFLDGSGIICDVAFVDQETDELARDRVCALLVQSKYPVAELWLLDKRLHQARRSETAQEQE